MTTPAPMNPSVTCKTCPSFLTPEQSIDKFQKSTGSPMCGRFGYVLGQPGKSDDQERQLLIYRANTCGAHGQDMPAIPAEYKTEVAMPDMDRMVESTDDDKANCRSCAMCTNFIRDDVVRRELGWSVGMCSAKGRLVMTNRNVLEARGCNYRKFGSVRTDTVGISMYPEFEDGFTVTPTALPSYFSAASDGVDPGEYETDREVAEADKANGIRAWRKVSDPDSESRFSFLPIYDRNHFDEAERSKIPMTGDDEHPELYVDHFGGVYLAAVCWTELDETPALWGQAGTGKTELYRHLAWLMCLPFERISITRSTELDDLAGRTHFTPDKGTYFIYGRVPLAWTKPCVMVIDEPNVGPPDVFQYLRPLIDNSRQLVVDSNSAERLARHPDCYLGFAMNPAWDPINVGAEQIGDADASRMFHVFISIPPPELERQIIQARVKLDGWDLSRRQLAAIMAIAAEVRGMVAQGTLPISWGIRPQIKVARASRWFDLVTAYRRAIGDYLDPEALEVLLDIVRAHVSTA